MRFAFDFSLGNQLLVFLLAGAVIIMLLYFAVLAWVLASDKITLSHLKKRGVEKEIRKKVFMRLKRWQKFIRRKKKKNKF